VLALSVTGCATTGDSPSSERPDPSQGYVAAVASMQGYGFALVLTDPVGREYLVRFDPRSKLRATHTRTRRVLLAIPPGDYRVSRVSWHDEWNRQLDSNPVPEVSPLGRSFSVEAGHFVYLGTFDSTGSKWPSFAKTRYQWSMKPREIAADDLFDAVGESYPEFAGWQIECLTCTAPTSTGRSAAPPPARPAPRERDAGVVVHYHRADGNYEGWVLSSYESFQRPEDLRVRTGGNLADARPVPGASWEDPAEPMGRDEFGAYWVLDEREFANGRVNFAIHRRDRKFESSKDRFWMIPDSTEGWTVEGDERVWLTRADAERAMRP
jgi:hypothetical protein